MCTKFVGKLEFNSLFWISSLTAGEEGPTRRIVEDVETQCWKTKLPFQRYEPTSVALFLEALETIKAAADEGMGPMIHFDMHGLASAGLEFTATQEFASWNALVERLRTINIASHNNLVVVSNACFGLHAIKQVTLTKAWPFYILIAPEQEVRVGFLEDHTAAFYAEMFSSGDIMSAYRRHLAGEMRVFHCEKMFGGALAKYIIRSCKGKSKRQ